MNKVLKKLFGGINLTWLKLILAAVIAGVLTGMIALVPNLLYTSFHAVTVTFEVWILLGILIIMNSKSNLDAALKCLVFFLISQPLVYLVQAPFVGFGIFSYYKNWLIWTALCFPMGFVGYFMKKGKWWGYLILLPMIAITGMSYQKYFSDFLFYLPRFLLITLFCACMMILYPIAIFENKKIKIVGASVGAAAIIALTVIGLLNPPVYSVELLSIGEDVGLDESYKVSLADESYGKAEIMYMPQFEDYIVHADFKKAGETVLTLEAPNGAKTEYNLSIKRDTYEVTQK